MGAHWLLEPRPNGSETESLLPLCWLRLAPPAAQAVEAPEALPLPHEPLAKQGPLAKLEAAALAEPASVRARTSL